MRHMALQMWTRCRVFFFIIEFSSRHSPTWRKHVLVQTRDDKAILLPPSDPAYNIKAWFLYSKNHMTEAEFTMTKKAAATAPTEVRQRTRPLAQPPLSSPSTPPLGGNADSTFGGGLLLANLFSLSFAVRGLKRKTHR